MFLKNHLRQILKRKLMCIRDLPNRNVCFAYIHVANNDYFIFWNDWLFFPILVPLGLWLWVYIWRWICFVFHFIIYI